MTWLRPSSTPYGSPSSCSTGTCTFAVTPRKTEGKLVFELGDGQWNIPGLRKVLEDIIPKRRTIEAYEVDHEFPSIGRRVMLLNARRVFDEDGSASAILLAIEDVTR